MPPIFFSANLMPFVRQKNPFKLSSLRLLLCQKKHHHPFQHQFIQGNVAMGFAVWGTCSEEVARRVLVQRTCELLELAELKDAGAIEDLKAYIAFVWVFMKVKFTWHFNHLFLYAAEPPPAFLNQ